MPGESECGSDRAGASSLPPRQPAALLSRQDRARLKRSHHSRQGPGLLHAWPQASQCQGPPGYASARERMLLPLLVPRQTWRQLQCGDVDLGES